MDLISPIINRWIQDGKEDPEALENFAMANSMRLILREERNFVEIVDSTFGIPARVVEAR